MLNVALDWPPPTGAATPLNNPADPVFCGVLNVALADAVKSPCVVAGVPDDKPLNKPVGWVVDCPLMPAMFWVVA